MFYPPEGLCWAEPEGGPIVFTFHFIGVGRGTGGFNFRGGNPPFWNLENVLSPGGTLLSRVLKGSNCFYFRFYWCRKRYWGCQIYRDERPFWNLENVLSPKGTLQSRTQWGPFDGLSILLCVPERELGIFVSWLKSAFWKSWNCLIPRRGSAKQNPNGVHLIFFPF